MLTLASRAATTGTTQPFLPGLCTANLVVAALSRHDRLAGVAVLARPDSWARPSSWAA